MEAIIGAAIGIGVTLWAMWLSGDPGSAATQQWGTALAFVTASAEEVPGAFVATRMERRR